MDEIDRESTFIREFSKTDCGIRLFGIATIALIPRVPVIVCQWAFISWNLQIKITTTEWLYIIYELNFLHSVSLIFSELPGKKKILIKPDVLVTIKKNFNQIWWW